MKTRNTALIALLMVACAGSAAAIAAIQGRAASTGRFDWNAWSSVVNEDPCGWLPPATLGPLGITTAGRKEVSRTETRCVWRAADGGPLFSAGVVTWDSAVNLVGEREGQKKQARDTTWFHEVGASKGTVTAIHRLDRGRLTIFPSSSEETAAIVLSGGRVRGDSEAVRKQRIERTEAFANALIAAFGL